MIEQVIVTLGIIAYVGAFAWTAWNFPMPGESFSDPEYDAKVAAHTAYMKEMRAAIAKETAEGFKAYLQLMRLESEIREAQHKRALE